MTIYKKIVWKNVLPNFAKILPLKGMKFGSHKQDTGLEICHVNKAPVLFLFTYLQNTYKKNHFKLACLSSYPF